MSTRRRDRDEEPVTVTAYPDGPLIVRGDVRVIGEDGEQLPRDRATLALCRCGMSSRAPLCDGTHKVAARRRLRAD
ncbi:MAG TPA: CDGSH iron-sulfur domain-containing protein [Actinomycetales bacterium]|nr:CDGSH iron-sulfur domain-containing protein [Actinomycetales bacterium]